MALIVGTRDGVYRFDREPSVPDDPDRDLADAGEQVLDAGTVYEVVDPGPVDGLLAAGEAGLFRSTDGGRTWTDLGVDGGAAVTVAASPGGRRLYAGTRPAHVHVSTDGGETWERSPAFAALPGRDDWENLGAVGPQVRALATDPAAPDRVAVGVEAAGVYVSPDGGETWVDRGRGVSDDVHDLLSLGDGSFVASCGRGLYRTDDAGRSWTALDTAPDQFWYSYYRESFRHDGRLFASGEDRAATRFRTEDRGSGAVWSSTDGGRTLERERYPGEDASFVLAWAASGETLYAATERGRLLRRAAGEWRSLGVLARPADDLRRVRSLCAPAS